MKLIHFRRTHDIVLTNYKEILYDFNTNNFLATALVCAYVSVFHKVIKCIKKIETTTQIEVTKR